MNVIIRKAGLDDATLIQKFGIKTFRDSFKALNTPENMKLYLEKSFSLEKIHEELSDPDTEFLLAFTDQHIAGYAKVISNKNNNSLKEKPGLELERIYVAQQYIGHQVGKVLLEKCFQVAKEKKTKVVWLGVWEHNPRAIAFYRKWGFEKFGEHVFMLGNDEQKDWLMKKTLS